MTLNKTRFGLLASDFSDNSLQLAVFYNAEEIGSQTYDGAHSSLIEDALRRLFFSLQEEESFFSIKQNSLLLSIDAAHGYHPSYQEKYDSNYLSLLGKGVVIKYDTKQRYTSQAHSTARVLQICKKYHLPHQKFISHGTVPPGSTVGPILSSSLGIPSLDLGIPTLSMHSIREIMAIVDQEILCTLITSLLQEGL